MVEILNWFDELIENWKTIIEINNKIFSKEQVSNDEIKIFFPFIPLELDCYTLYNAFYHIFPKLFNKNGDSLIIILNDPG